MSEQRMAAAAVVVGVDGSGIALSAVRWATQEAQRRGAPLRIVHVASYAERSAAGERRAASILTLAHTTAEKAGGHVAVTTEAVPGDAASALAEAAADAQLLVVGMGGGERYEDIRLHSTALSVCTAARCPVAIVRGAPCVPPVPTINHGATVHGPLVDVSKQCVHRGGRRKAASCYPAEADWLRIRREDHA